MYTYLTQSVTRSETPKFHVVLHHEQVSSSQISLLSVFLNFIHVIHHSYLDTFLTTFSNLLLNPLIWLHLVFLEYLLHYKLGLEISSIVGDVPSPFFLLLQ